MRISDWSSDVCSSDLLNVGRIGALLSGLPSSVAGVTVNRFCASGLTAIAMAADRIRVGDADVMFAAGTESTSLVPTMGVRTSFSPEIFQRDENLGIAYGMGLPAVKVATRGKLSSEDQEAFELGRESWRERVRQERKT